MDICITEKSLSPTQESLCLPIPPPFCAYSFFSFSFFEKESHSLAQENQFWTSKSRLRRQNVPFLTWPWKPQIHSFSQAKWSSFPSITLELRHLASSSWLLKSQVCITIPTDSSKLLRILGWQLPKHMPKDTLLNNISPSLTPPYSPIFFWNFQLLFWKLGI